MILMQGMFAVSFSSLRYWHEIFTHSGSNKSIAALVIYPIRFHYVLFAIFDVILETISWMDWNKSKPGVMMVQELQRWHLRGVTWYVSVSMESTCNMSQQL